MTTKNKGNLYILFTALLWSTGGLLIKFIPWNPYIINSLRSLLALLFFVVIRRGIRIKVNKTILLAAVCLMLTNLLYVMANKMTTAANAIVLQYLSPIFVLVFACIQQKKLPSWKQVAVVLVAFGGMVLFFLDQLDPGRLAGNLLAIGAGLCFAGVFFLNAREEASSDDSSMLAFGMSFLVGLPFYGSGSHEITLPAVLAILALGLVQVGFAYYLFGKGCKLTTPVNASLIGLIEAVLNPVWVLLALGERPGPWALAGGGLILGAVVCNILFLREDQP